ncbi:MAG: hypothetical protein LUC50_03985 [Ruminococcus sp.]|nr:hypothetical protein [Ruminococcus sp.]
MDNYEHIRNMKYPFDLIKPRMSLHDRAAQFSPFAALTGYEDETNETARLTDDKLILDDDRQVMLNDAAQKLLSHPYEKVPVTVEYFVPDYAKEGGKYATYSGKFRWIDTYNRFIVFYDGKEIPLDDIYDIQINLNDALDSEI